jgi:hypothetical protein
MTEYDPVFERKTSPADEADLEAVRRAMVRAAGPYLRSPLPWLLWAVVLPLVALTTPAVMTSGGLRGVLFLWSGGILAAGVVEMFLYRRSQAGSPRSPLAGWIMRSQGNLSALVLVLSLLLAWHHLVWALPGLWLLLLGHSLYTFGKLLLPSLRSAGLLYQLGGVVALVAGDRSLQIFALTILIANCWVALGIRRQAAFSS